MQTAVSVQNLLPALPQIFPGVQLIPLERIRSNPDNPGAPVTDEMVQALADNIAEAGLLNPIKVMADPAQPLAPGVALHPENPRLTADGRLLTVGDFNYLNLCGELRYRAFQKLGKTAIPAYVLAPSPEEAVIITRQDNLSRDRGWWADYQTIENLIKANPNQTQRVIAVKLEMDKPKVTRALQLLPLLNPEARALIGSFAPNSNKGIKPFSDLAACQLAALGPGTGQKPGARKKEPGPGEPSPQLWPYQPIPSETQDLVRRALGVAIDHGMTEAKVKSFVAWIKQGHQPEDYREKEPEEATPDPYADHWPTLAPGIKVKRKTGGYHIQMTIPDGATAWTAASAAFNALKGQPLSASGGMPSLAVAPPKASPSAPALAHGTFLSEIAGSILWKEIKQVPGHVLNKLSPRFTRIFHQTSSGVQRIGVKNQVWATFITLFLVLMVGSFLISRATRLLTWGVYRMVNFGHLMPSQRTALTTFQKGTDTAAPRPQVEGQALLVPGQGTELASSQNGPGTNAGGKTLTAAIQGVSVKANLASDGVTVSPQLPAKVLGVNIAGIQAPSISLPFGGNSANTTATSKPKFHEPHVPDELQQRVEDDKNAALSLTKQFYEFSYKHNFSYWRENFDRLAADYGEAFDAQYLSQDRQDKFKDEKLYYDFVPKGDPLLMKLTDTTDDIAVMGTATLRGDAVYPGKVIWKKRLALVTTLYHNPDNSWVVIKIKETPAP